MSDEAELPGPEPLAGSVAVLRLKPGEDRRLRAGHLWVFSNEVDTQATPLGGFAAGASRGCTATAISSSVTPT